MQAIFHVCSNNAWQNKSIHDLFCILIPIHLLTTSNRTKRKPVSALQYLYKDTSTVSRMGFVHLFLIIKHNTVSIKNY